MNQTFHLEERDLKAKEDSIFFTQVRKDLSKVEKSLQNVKIQEGMLFHLPIIQSQKVSLRHN